MHNSETILPLLVQRLQSVLETLTGEYELVLVNVTAAGTKVGWPFNGLPRNTPGCAASI